MKMALCKGRTCSLLAMITLTSCFFVVELIFGYISNSLALIGDSYHMLSDLVALIVALVSLRISKWTSKNNTYGWARAEVVGALVNSIFLIALCFTIFCEAIERMLGGEHWQNPDIMLIVGCIGLFINICGLILFGRHSHNHNHTTSKPNADVQRTLVLQDDPAVSQVEDDEISSTVEVSEKQLNMKGVFLHVLGDAMGSVIVIVSGLIVKFVMEEWKYKVDPILSILLAVIITCTAIPLLKESTMILLQTVPNHIEVHELKEKLLQSVEGILGLHEFHVWQLDGNKIIVSAHICCSANDYVKIAEDLKIFFHKEGIHSTTIQPEFVEVIDHSNNQAKNLNLHSCLLDCDSETCIPYKCCSSQSTALHSIKTMRNSKGTIKSNEAMRTVPATNQFLSTPALPLLSEDKQKMEHCSETKLNGTVVNKSNDELATLSEDNLQKEYCNDIKQNNNVIDKSVEESFAVL